MSKEEFGLETTVKKKLYEAMFLVNSADASADWDGVEAAVRKILERAEAEIVSMEKWDDRRLAYQIKGKTRGVYILCYFRTAGGMIQGIERGVQLSERIIRVLILCAEHLRQENIEKDASIVSDEGSGDSGGAESASVEPEQVAEEAKPEEGPEKKPEEGPEEKQEEPEGLEQAEADDIVSQGEGEMEMEKGD